ncbi:hypothetical protein [Streptomyces sp. WAC 06725]|uniref:hypothetical protein n=1 Tax=Streptomyces sp. WAC 06725 TaxID=2203209 RepID=UPI000F742CD9|nr:hypothetical protein [Streptomyces sp. WAC 06725]
MRVVISPLVPEGEIVTLFEREGELIWAFAPGHITNEAVEVANQQLRHLVGHGLWGQRWGGDQQEPPHRAAS